MSGFLIPGCLYQDRGIVLLIFANFNYQINSTTMEKFMLIVREDLEKIGRLTPEERFAMFPDMLDWVKSLADSGNYITGEPLAITGRYVSRDEVLSDGPFIEAKEGVSGYDLIMAENINQAVAIAQSCPMVMQGLAVREVRPIQMPVTKAPE